MNVFTWLAVVVGTVWPSCFKVLGLRPEKLSRGTVVKTKKKKHHINCELKPQTEQKKRSLHVPTIGTEQACNKTSMQATKLMITKNKDYLEIHSNEHYQSVNCCGVNTEISLCQVKQL